MMQMSEASHDRLEATHEASRARSDTSAARSDATLAHLFAAFPLVVTTSASSEISSLIEIGRNMTKMSILTVGNSHAGAFTAVSFFLSVLTPLISLFNDCTNLTKLICPGESLSVSVVSNLSSTPNLLALSNLVNLDNFKRKGP